jgi:hypothetical protein
MVQGMQSKQKESNVFTVTIMESFYKTIFLVRACFHLLMCIYNAWCCIYYFTLRTGFYSVGISKAAYRHVKHRLYISCKRRLNVSCCSLSKTKRSLFRLFKQVIFLRSHKKCAPHIYAGIFFSVNGRYICCTVFYPSITVSPTSAHLQPVGFPCVLAPVVLVFASRGGTKYATASR